MRNQRAIRERERACLVKALQTAGWAEIPKAVPAPRSSVITDLQQGTDDVGTKALLENWTQQRVIGGVTEGIR